MDKKIFYKGLAYFKTTFYYWKNNCVSSYFYPKTIKYVVIYEQEISKSVILTFLVYENKECKYMLGCSTFRIMYRDVSEYLKQSGIILIEN